MENLPKEKPSQDDVNSENTSKITEPIVKSENKEPELMKENEKTSDVDTSKPQLLKKAALTDRVAENPPDSKKVANKTLESNKVTSKTNKVENVNTESDKVSELIPVSNETTDDPKTELDLKEQKDRANKSQQVVAVTPEVVNTLDEPLEEVVEKDSIEKLEKPVKQSIISKNQKKSEEKHVTVNEQKKAITVTEDAEADGWEFDDWDNDAEIAQTKTDITSNKPTKPEAVQEEADSGWDLDDWDDDADVMDTSQSKKSSHYFPVLDDISPKKQIKSESGILGNLSKFIISSDSAQPSEPAAISNVFDKLADGNQSNSYSWGGWKQWGGVASLISTASDGVASITSQVSSAIESGIGVPDPAEMARVQLEGQRKKDAEKVSSSKADDSSPTAEEQAARKREIMMLGNFVSGVTQISNRVITGGLDTLEGIGKKTMNILQENDPGLLKKRKMLMLDNDSPVLSQVRYSRFFICKWRI